MNWLYHFRFQKDHTGPFSMLQIYLRTYEYDDQGELWVGDKIVSLDILAMESFMEMKKGDEKAMKFYFEKMQDREFNIEYWPLSDAEQEVFEAKITLYLNVRMFSSEDVFTWARKILILNNFSVDQFTKATYNEFADTNEVMQLLSRKGNPMDKG